MNNLTELTKAYKQKVQAKIEQLEADVKKLQAKAKELNAEEQIKMNSIQKQINNVKSQFVELIQKGRQVGKKATDQLTSNLENIDTMIKKENEQLDRKK
jgi:t-SNARE complex subunit (syntaxin)